MNQKNVNIKTEDFYNLVAKETGGNASPTVARKYLEGTLKVILNELKLNERVYIYNFGTFEIYHAGGYDKKINLDGTVRYIQPKEKVRFKPSQTLEKMINENDYQIMPKKRKKRNRRNVENAEYEKRSKYDKPTLEENVAKIFNNLMGD